MRHSSRLLGVVLLIVLCASLVFWQNRARESGGISLPAGVALWSLRPAQRALAGISNWGSDVWRTMTRRGDINADNRRLRERVAYLEGTNHRLQRYRQENIELREMLKMSKPQGGKSIAANIVSLDATDYARSVILNVGSRQGVRAKDVVYTAHGVVGQVVSEAPFASAVVLLLTDRTSSVGAMTARTMAKGIVQGTGERLCKMQYLDFQADVREGDLVVTSGLVLKPGLQSIFPKGLVIGRVLKVEKDKTYSRTTAYVDPAVPFDQISAVWVRTGIDK